MKPHPRSRHLLSEGPVIEIVRNVRSALEYVDGDLAIGETDREAMT